MAFAETANLVARLTLKDEFSKPLQGIQGKLNSLGSAASRAGKVLAVGLGAGLAVGGAVITRSVESGLQSLADLESATTSVDAAIKQMGLTGQVTSGQIATWANEIEASVHGAFDDTAITQAATTLIRYGKVTTANLRPALVVVTDLAAKTGDVSSASSLLAKALADPEHAAGRLARQGVILTKSQQDQIKALVKAGKVGAAQKLVLDAVAKATKGAADASQGPYQKSLSTLHDAIRDAERALAEGFLPILEQVRDFLKNELAKPDTLNKIRDFGKGLASGLGHLIEVAQGLPWDAIGNALKIGGVGAKAVLDAFESMPAWVQTAIATGWGLNKVTGGAVTGLIGQLASGLIKGVLGINAGVVNVTGGVVNAGGVPTAGVPTAARPGISALGKVFLIGEAIGLVAAVDAVRESIVTGLDKQSSSLHDAVSAQINNPKTTSGQLAQSLAGVEQGIEKLSHDPVGNALLGDQLSKLEQIRAELSSALVKQDDAAKAAFRNQERADQANATQLGQTRSAVDRSADRIVGAIQRNRPIVNVHVGLRTTTIVKVGGTLHAVTSGIEFTGIPH